MKNILSRTLQFSFIAIALCYSACCFAQDSARQIEPGQKTSFDNYRLLILAVVGLLLLVGICFWFKRTRKH